MCLVDGTTAAGQTQTRQPGMLLVARLAALALLLHTVLGVGEESECEMPAKDRHCSMDLTCSDFFRQFSCDQLEAIN